MLSIFKKINERLETSINDSDVAYFYDLMLAGEQLTKLVALSLIACLTDDKKRHRYSQEHKVIRADSLGEWSKIIDEVLIGPSSQYFNPLANIVQQELTERLGNPTWQYKSCKQLIDAIRQTDSNYEDINIKVSGRNWFSHFTYLRNKTKGHGAYSPEVLSKICPLLSSSISNFQNNYYLFNNIEWAYLHRNLSGKYKVSNISEDAQRFHYLKSERNSSYENGVYIFINDPIKVELLTSNSDITDFLFPNGGFNQKRFEIISYITGDKDHRDASTHLIPPGELPSSETEGNSSLELVNNSFTNIPIMTQIYVNRIELENELKQKLLEERYPIVTLTGRGGIGKTTLAISVLKSLCNLERYTSIIWFSARDIDLITEGAKPVKPHVLSKEDIASEYVKLLMPNESKDKNFKANAYFENELTASDVGPTLFVFDNFETVKDPVDLFNWLDTYIRSPNKVLITSRFRDFKADYPIEVGGMNEEEFKQLVLVTSEILGINNLLKPDYLEELYIESDGHPYVIKVLLGEIAKEGKIGKVKRIVATKEDILTALFERTYSGLTPVARRIFLTLSNWRSTIPEIAIEAVLMREDNEHMDVKKGIEELHRSSLIIIDTSEKDGMLFISVPYSASVFGKKKLSVSSMKTAIQADTEILHKFGVGIITETHLGIEPRLIKFFRDIAKRVSSKHDKLEFYIPILEFLCRRYPNAWLTLASLYEEEGYLEKSLESIQHYLEVSENEKDKYSGWEKLAILYNKTNNLEGEIQALIEICELPNTSIDKIRIIAFKLNLYFKNNKLLLELTEKKIIINRFINSFSESINRNSLESDDCSLLARLYLTIGNYKEARKFVKLGLQIEPNHTHCLKVKSMIAQTK